MIMILRIRQLHIIDMSENEIEVPEGLYRRRNVRICCVTPRIRWRRTVVITGDITRVSLHRFRCTGYGFHGSINGCR